MSEPRSRRLVPDTARHGQSERTLAAQKRWNLWNWIGPDFVFSVTVADIDFASFCAVAFIDLRSGQRLDSMDFRRAGFAALPEQVDQSLRWKSGNMAFTVVDGGDHASIEFSSAGVQGASARADFVIRRPRGHESLDVVVPWTRARFQLNSKDNSMPCEGSVTVGGPVRDAPGALPRRTGLRPRGLAPSILLEAG